MPTFMKRVTKIERKSAKFIQSPTHVTMLNFRNVCVSEFNHCLLWRQLPPPPPSTTTLNNRSLQQPLPFHHHPDYRYDHCCSTNDWHPFTSTTTHSQAEYTANPCTHTHWSLTTASLQQHHDPCLLTTSSRSLCCAAAKAANPVLTLGVHKEIKFSNGGYIRTQGWV